MPHAASTSVAPRKREEELEPDVEREQSEQHQREQEQGRARVDRVLDRRAVGHAGLALEEVVQQRAVIHVVARRIRARRAPVHAAGVGDDVVDAEERRLRRRRLELDPAVEREVDLDPRVGVELLHHELAGVGSSVPVV